MRFLTQQSDLIGLNGLRIVSVKPLDESEYDKEDVGPMYTVKLENERSVTVYADEVVTSFVSDSGKVFATREEALAEDTVAPFTKDRHDSVVGFPCKLHDTVWFATQYGVMSGNVSSLYFDGKTHISISSNRNAESPNFAAFAVSTEDIGKKIFFSKEEAEKCDFCFSVLRLCCN